MDEQVSFAIPDKGRNRHIYIAGKTRHGKSTLIHWMALQDIDQDKGVCILDPHGDLVKKLIHYIPEHRVKDTIYLDFTQPIPLDFFYAQTPKEKDYLVDDIVSTFRRLSEGNWGVRMDSILRNVVVALLAHPETTFLDVHRMITDRKFRQEVIRQSDNETIKRYFAEKGEFEIERADSKVAITSRMSKFLLSPVLNTIVGHPEPKLKLPEVMQTKKVLLINLNEMAEETKTFLGTLIVARIHRAAMQRTRPDERVPFYLYADEFEKFRTSSFEDIIAEAGKFQLCLTLAHQGIGQIKDSALRSALRGVSTFVFFRLDEETAKFFKSEIQGYDDFNLQWLRVGEAVYRAVNGFTILVHTPAP